MARISKAPEERKKEIIQKAMELIQQKGYENTSIQDIVKSLNVAQGLFYYYFKSKEELLEELAKEQIQGFAEYLYKALYHEKQLDALTRLKVFYTSLLELHLQNGNDSQTLFFELEKNVKFFMKHQQYENELFIRELTNIIIQGNEEGIFHCPYPLESSRLLVVGCTEIMMDDCFCLNEQGDVNYHHVFHEVLNKYTRFIIYAASKLLNVDVKHLENLLEEITKETGSLMQQFELRARKEEGQMPYETDDTGPERL